MTREQRKRKRTANAVRIAVCIFLAIMVLFAMSDAAAQEQPVNGWEYLDSIGADQSQQEHIVEVLYD